MKQSYRNYIRFYTPHHFVYYPLATGFFAAAVYFSFTREESALWIFISVIFLFLIALSFMLRQHYALMLQNRIVRLELRYRYFTLTGKRLEEFEHELRDSQLFSLRFASDSELPALVERARHDKIGGEKIKQSIVDWKGDYDRV
jgi:hypothetical protein